MTRLSAQNLLHSDRPIQKTPLEVDKQAVYFKGFVRRVSISC